MHRQSFDFRPGRYSRAFLLAGMVASAALAVPTPIVELKFDGGSGTTVSNTGSGGGTANLTTLNSRPIWSTNAPANGTNSIDFYTPTTYGEYAVDLSNSTTLNALKSLKSFTIAGWINVKGTIYGPGGNRLVAWNNSYLGGVELAAQSDGALGLGVNQWNNEGGVKSSGGKFASDAGASFNNWRFFAVTYDGTATSNNVKFYFGNNSTAATLDVTRSYNRGTTSANIGPQLAIGNHTTADDPYQSGSTTIRQSTANCLSCQPIYEPSSCENGVTLFGLWTRMISCFSSQALAAHL